MDSKAPNRCHASFDSNSLQLPIVLELSHILFESYKIEKVLKLKKFEILKNDNERNKKEDAQFFEFHFENFQFENFLIQS